MAAFAIQLSQNVQNQIVSYAAKYSVDPLVLAGIAQVSSNGRQFNSDGSLVVTLFGVGIMGINKSVAMSLGFDATNENQNIEAGAAYLAAQLQAFVGQYPLSIAAYVTSAQTVLTANGVPPIAQVQNFVYNVSTIAAQAGSASVSAVYAVSSAATVDPNEAATETQQHTGFTGINFIASSRSQAESEKNLDTLRQTLQPQLQIPDPAGDTLTETAWYADTGLITGNPHIRATVQPVSFMVFLDRNDPTQFLSIPTNDQSTVKTPIEVQLNTSMTSFEIASKHVYQRTPSRTGMHITLWGMQPDTISGTGSTGVFMNQFGLTDFMSTSPFNDDIIKLLTSGFGHSFARNNVVNDEVTDVQPGGQTNPVRTQQGNFVPSPTSGFNLISTVQQTPSGSATQTQVSGDFLDALDIIDNQDIQNADTAFRVAAQDAFVEFLKLFQMNGNIYFYNQNYNGVMTGSEQLSASAWSPQTGATSFQQHSRNNDVMTRGYVAMRYRNNVYLGYFKSLSWTQDAEKPFMWNFSFVFQVEKTYTSLYFAQPSTQQTERTVSQNFNTQQTVDDTGTGLEVA